MNKNKKPTFQTQEFATLVGVTVRTLHHYDRVGLLKPSARTEAGYRLYEEKDFARIQQIITLKFIGMPLHQIKEILSVSDPDLTKTLKLQRQVIQERLSQLNMAAKAIEKAEEFIANGEKPSLEIFRQIVEVMNMENNMEWVKKYYTKEQLEDLAQRGTPEVIKKAEQDWATLIRDVEENFGADPASPKAQTLAGRWSKLIEAFTGSNPEIKKNLNKLYDEKDKWPSTFKKPYSDEAEIFIGKALSIYKKTT